MVDGGVIQFLVLALVAQTEGAPLIGTQAPAFTTIEWIGEAPRLDGKVVLVRFWLGDCLHCTASAPALNALQKEFEERGLVVVGIHHPKSEEAKPLEFVKTWSKKLALEFPVGQDLDWSTVKAFGVGTTFQSYTSVSVLVDRGGVIRWVHDGGALDEAAQESARAIIARLVGDTTQVVLRVKGWTCVSCAQKTMAALERVEGVRHVKVDGQEKRVVVTYDPAMANEAKLIGSITQLGYSAEVSSPSTSPVRSWQGMP